MSKSISILSVFPDVTAALSLSGAGNMKFIETDEDIQIVRNQKKFLENIGIQYMDTIYGYVNHGIVVEVVDESSPRRIKGADALVSKTPGIYVAVTVADCFPVYFYDKNAKVCAVAHAGWRGTVKGVIPATIMKMISIGARASDIHIELGPGISQANFEFHYAEMIQEFGPYSQDKYIDAGSSLDKITIDLQAILGDQIQDVGVPLENIKYCSDCTFADEKFFSARRHQGESHSAMLAVIGIDKK